MTTKETTYFNELLWVQSIMGDLSSQMLVNNHKFNTVLPDDVAKNVKHAIERLESFERLYRLQFNDVKSGPIKMER